MGNSNDDNNKICCAAYIYAYCIGRIKNITCSHYRQTFVRIVLCSRVGVLLDEPYILL